MIQNQKQTQVQNQILTQFYVYQDLQNFVNLLYSLKEVNDYFKGQNDHAMVKLCRNKVILQMNLSNCIHYDLEQQNESSGILLKQKKNAENLLQQLEPELKEFKEYIEWYKTYCLNQKVYLNQQNLEDTQIVANFNQNVLSQIIPAINSMDEQVKNLQGQQQFSEPNRNQIREKAIKFKDHTRESLEKNFPTKETQIQRGDNKQAHMKNDQEQTFLFYEKLIIKNFKQFEEYEKNQYENIKVYLSKLKGTQEADEKYAFELYQKSKVKVFHPLYYKFYLFGIFLRFIQTNNNKNEPNVNEFLKFYKNNNNQGQDQIYYKHFVQYLFTIQQKKVNVDYKSYCDYYEKLQQFM